MTPWFETQKHKNVMTMLGWSNPLTRRISCSRAAMSKAITNKEASYYFPIENKVKSDGNLIVLKQPCILGFAKPKVKASILFTLTWIDILSELDSPFLCNISFSVSQLPKHLVNWKPYFDCSDMLSTLRVLFSNS